MAESNRAVSLEEVLANREARVERQREMLSRGGCVVSFTVNMPGPVKDNDEARAIFAAGLKAVEMFSRGAGLTVAERKELSLPTGPEALFRFDAEALAVKAAMVRAEMEHPLGRLFDLDVPDPRGGSISRAALGLSPRACFVCGELAAACGRSRRHDMAELLQAVRDMLASFGDGE